MPVIMAFVHKNMSDRNRETEFVRATAAVGGGYRFWICVTLCYTFGRPAAPASNDR